MNGIKLKGIRLEKKLQEYYRLSEKDPLTINFENEPYKPILDLFGYRNNLVHHKSQYKKATELNQTYITDTELQLPHEFVRELPEKLQKCIIELCNINSTQIPEWLTPHPNLGWIK